jgi:hypothetical protein
LAVFLGKSKLITQALPFMKSKDLEGQSPVIHSECDVSIDFVK